MRKLLSALLVVLMTLVFVMPNAALAAKGGQGKGKGQAANASAADKDAAKAVRQAAKEANRALKEEQKAARKGAQSQETDADEPDDVGDDVGDGDVVDEPAPEKLTGIANALSRIQRNLARAQEKVDAGTKKQLPPGLVLVMEKFMAWLGVVPEPDPVDDGEPPVVDPGDETPGDETPGDETPGDETPGDETPPDPTDPIPGDEPVVPDA